MRVELHKIYFASKCPCYTCHKARLLAWVTGVNDYSLEYFYKSTTERCKID